MVREEEGLDPLNSKLAKELRGYARMGLNPKTPVSKLLAKPVPLKDGGEAIVAINSLMSERGAYRALKEAVEKDPEVLERLRATVAYQKLIAVQQTDGGPLYENRTYPTKGGTP